jgi:DNA (cytosine-5)-methyltransferase 1
MHGGKRSGSGRNPLPDNQKKIAKTIYITPVLQDDIETYAEGDSFSEKCIDLISSQINLRNVLSNKEVRFIDLFAGLGGIAPWF